MTVFGDARDKGYGNPYGSIGSCGERRLDICLRFQHVTYGKYYPEIAHFFQYFKAIPDLHLLNTAGADNDGIRIKASLDAKHDEAAACHATLEQVYEALNAADTEQRKARAECVQRKPSRTLCQDNDFSYSIQLAIAQKKSTCSEDLREEKAEPVLGPRTATSKSATN